MNKYLLLFFLAVCPSLLFSQQKSFNISWSGTKIFQTSISRVEVPAFEEEHLSFDDDAGLLYFVEWDSNEIINETSVELSNVSYSVVSRTDLKGLPIHTIPNVPKVSLQNLMGEK